MNTQETRKLAVELYKAGVPMHLITKQTGLPYYSINYHRQRAGVPTRVSDSKPNGNPTMMLNAIRMNLQGAPMDLIAKETGIDETQLRNWYTHHGIAIDARPSFNGDNDQSWPAMPADLETNE